jgi:hypothetical protein
LLAPARLARWEDIVLDIGILGSGSADYYLDEVATNAEAYYLGAGEAPGRWSSSAGYSKVVIRSQAST